MAQCVHQESEDCRKCKWIGVFQEFKDGDEQLHQDEILELMRVCGTDPTDKDVDEYIKEADKNDDMGVDCDEFCSFMEKELNKGNPIHRLVEAFEFYDKDNSGYIERDELKVIMRDCNQDPDDEDLIDSVILSADLNGDGKIDITEFVHRLHCLST